MIFHEKNEKRYFSLPIKNMNVCILCHGGEKIKLEGVTLKIKKSPDYVDEEKQKKYFFTNNSIFITVKKLKKKVKILIGEKCLGFYFVHNFFDDDTFCTLGFANSTGELFRFEFDNIKNYFETLSALGERKSSIFGYTGKHAMIHNTLSKEGIPIYFLDHISFCVGRKSEIYSSVWENFTKYSFRSIKSLQKQLIDEGVSLIESLRILRRELRSDYSSLEKEKIRNIFSGEEKKKLLHFVCKILLF